MPREYSPSQELGSVYLELKRFDDAPAAYKRAFAKAENEGKRRVNILLSCANVYEAMGDKAGAQRTLEQALKLAQELPEKDATTLVPRIQARLAKYKTGQN